MRTRILHTKIWQDEFIAELPPLQKLLFIYYISNDNIGLTGIYELTDRQTAFDTGLSKAQINEGKTIFEKAGKIYFYKNWQYVANSKRLNGYVGEKLETAIEKERLSINPEITSYFDSVSKNLNRVSENTDRVSGISDTPINHNREIINNKPEIGVVKGEEQKTSKNSHTPCTTQELREVADSLNVSIKEVERMHQRILDKIEAKELDPRKHKTVFFTLKSWLDLDLKKGYIKPYFLKTLPVTPEFKPNLPDKPISPEKLAEFRRQREMVLGNVGQAMQGEKGGEGKMIKKKGKRGFASMDKKKQLAIASKGGKSAHAKGVAHVWTSKEAKAAGRKGGKTTQARKHQALAA